MSSTNHLKLYTFTVNNYLATFVKPLNKSSSKKTKNCTDNNAFSAKSEIDLGCVKIIRFFLFFVESLPPEAHLGSLTHRIRCTCRCSRRSPWQQWRSTRSTGTSGWDTSSCPRVTKPWRKIIVCLMLICPVSNCSQLHNFGVRQLCLY